MNLFNFFNTVVIAIMIFHAFIIWFHSKQNIHFLSVIAREIIELKDAALNRKWDG